jgi:hypothetical protein
VFLLTYALARLKEVSELSADAKQNAFVGQLQFKLLFDLLLVIDNAVKQKNSSKEKFVDHAIFLLDRAGHSLPKLGDINGDFRSNFGGCMKNALDGKLVMKGKALDSLQCDIAVAYGLRNRLAHRIESHPVIWKDFDRIQRAVFRTFCATLDYLY